MATVKGTDGLLAFAKATVWKTKTTLGANHRQPFIQSTVDPKRGIIQDETLCGPVSPPPNLGDISADGNDQWHGDYRQHGLDWALILGTAGVPTTVEAAVAFKHALKFAASTAGLFGTWGRDDGAEVFTLQAKPKSLLFRTESGGAARETQESVFGIINEGGSSAAWTYLNDPCGGGGRVIRHKDGVFRMNTAAGGALGASDEICPTTFEATVDRKTESIPGANDCEEPGPEAGALAEGMIRLDFLQFSTELHALLYAAYRDETLMKMDAVYTSPTLITGSATNFYERSFYAPAMRVIECPRKIENPGRNPLSVLLSCHDGGATEPTGFPSGYTDPLTVEFQNEISTDYLA